MIYNIGFIIGCVGVCLLLICLLIILPYVINRYKKKDYDVEFAEVFQRYSKPKHSPESSPISTAGHATEIMDSWLSDYNQSMSSYSPVIPARYEYKFELPQPAAKNKIGQELGHLNPRIYNKRVIRSLSEHSDSSNHSSFGSIEFSTVINKFNDTLMVSLFRIINLPARKQVRLLQNEKRDIVTFFCLLPDAAYQTTKTKHNTLNPVFNESFLYQLYGQPLNNRWLLVSCFDISSPNNMWQSLGHVKVDLCDLVMNKETQHLEELCPLEEVVSTMGEVKISMTFRPELSQLEAKVDECKNLPDFTPNKNFNGVFFRVFVLHRERVVKFMDSEAHTLASSISFEQGVVMPCSERHLDHSHVVIHLMRCEMNHAFKYEHHKVISLGRVEFGPFIYARHEALSHWHQIVDQPNQTVAMWHKLQSPEVELKASYP